jgi:hypothetical protein
MRCLECFQRLQVRDAVALGITSIHLYSKYIPQESLLRTASMGELRRYTTGLTISSGRPRTIISQHNITKGLLLWQGAAFLASLLAILNRKTALSLGRSDGC